VARSVRVIIGDRDPFIVRGLASILAAETSFEVVATCLDGSACMESIRDLSPDLALLGASLPLMNGLQILGSINSERLRTRVVFISTSVDDSTGTSAMAGGAYGVISQDATPQFVIRSLRKVASGKKLPPTASSDSESRSSHQHGPADTFGILLGVLTEREHQIVRLLGEGLSSKEVGRRLYLSEGSIKAHLHRIYQKLAMHNRAVLAETARPRSDGPEPSST
jgi:DNA-binding NarL/FixJ family response regulator